MRCDYHPPGAGIIGYPQHDKGIFNALGTIIHTRQNVGMDVNEVHGVTVSGDTAKAILWSGGSQTLIRFLSL